MNQVEFVRLGQVIGATRNGMLFYCDHVFKEEEIEKTRKRIKYGVVGKAFQGVEEGGHESQAHHWPALREVSPAPSYSWLGGWECFTTKHQWSTVCNAIDLYHMIDLSIGRHEAWDYFVNAGYEHWHSTP